MTVMSEIRGAPGGALPGCYNTHIIYIFKADCRPNSPTRIGESLNNNSVRLLLTKPQLTAASRWPIIESAGGISRQQKRALVRDYSGSHDGIGLLQTLTTLVPLALLWIVAIRIAGQLPWLTVMATFGITLFLVRVFALMHECGHGSLFRSQWANRTAGFVFGVISGMPQFVWSQHHDYHHRHNGNWERYRGPLATLAVDEYVLLSPSQQRRYWLARHIALAPLGGFVYLIFNPRFNWLKGNGALLWHLLRRQPASTFQCRYWKTWKEYRHMTANNIALGCALIAMCMAAGTGLVLAIYTASLSIAGGAGIMLFTVQHNFEGAYATSTATWDIDQGAIAGTSFLVLPAWMNWFTANIGYHHVHHLSAAIPNYRLVACHSENQQLFTTVPRVRLGQVPAALKCLLWDRVSGRIIPLGKAARKARGA
jgi:acyl-lipid omega-6 desaturase (Delta-12 desaturase)